MCCKNQLHKKRSFRKPSQNYFLMSRPYFGSVTLTSVGKCPPECHNAMQLQILLEVLTNLYQVALVLQGEYSWGVSSTKDRVNDVKNLRVLDCIVTNDHHGLDFLEAGCQHGRLQWRSDSGVIWNQKTRRTKSFYPSINRDFRLGLSGPVDSPKHSFLF